MRKLFDENKIFLIPWFLMILIISVVLLRFHKTDIQIFINAHNSPFLDLFFKYWTWLGDGINVTIIALFLLFIKYRYAVITGASLIITGITVQILKHTFFSEYYRPLLYFKINYKGNYTLHTAAGVEPASFFSFPSGHTAAAFALFFSLSIFIKNKYLKFFFFICAVLVGYSRIYLSWHFLGDALAGSLIGIFTTSICYLFISKYNNNWLDNSILKNDEQQNTRI